jgi:hypothetical protein
MPQGPGKLREESGKQLVLVSTQKDPRDGALLKKAARNSDVENGGATVGTIGAWALDHHGNLPNQILQSSNPSFFRMHRVDIYV